MHKSILSSSFRAAMLVFIFALSVQGVALAADGVLTNKVASPTDVQLLTDGDIIDSFRYFATRQMAHKVLDAIPSIQSAGIDVYKGSLPNGLTMKLCYDFVETNGHVALIDPQRTWAREVSLMDDDQISNRDFQKLINKSIGYFGVPEIKTVEGVVKQYHWNGMASEQKYTIDLGFDVKDQKMSGSIHFPAK